MTISILVPVYKGSETLDSALNSILDQTVPPDEVIIGDDTRPSDKSEIQKIKKIIRKFVIKAKFEVKIYHNTTNLGCQGNFQKLVDLATKDLVLFLAHDDIFSNDAVSIVMKAFHNNPKVGFLTRPYFWFYDDINKPIRYVPPPSLEFDCLIPSIEELCVGKNVKEIKKNVGWVFGSIGQISGLAMRRKLMKAQFHPDIFPGHMYPIVDIWKTHRGIFIKDYILAVGTATSQSRTNSKIYEDSPTEQWVRMFRNQLSYNKFDLIYDVSIDLIGKNYVGLIQIKNYGTLNQLLREIKILICINSKNLVNINFWIFAVLSLILPRKFLNKFTDWFKSKINSVTIKKIYFKY